MVQDTNQFVYWTKTQRDNTQTSLCIGPRPKGSCVLWGGIMIKFKFWIITLTCISTFIFMVTITAAPWFSGETEKNLYSNATVMGIFSSFMIAIWLYGYMDENDY